MQVLDKREATRQLPTPQQAKEAISVQLHSGMAMWSEIKCNPDQTCQSPNPRSKKETKQTTVFMKILTS